MFEYTTKSLESAVSELLMFISHFPEGSEELKLLKKRIDEVKNAIEVLKNYEE